MSDLASYVLKHTDRGECKCGKCMDVGNKPDPAGHTVDMVFFKVAKTNGATADDFKRLTDVDLFKAESIVALAESKEQAR